ncbi:MAG: deoxynucleoside kinase [Anaerolineaceae bacterium]|nr:deoxynucleoside kinase [Anaerolineaceae bacterium]MBN2677399.1 deoxynucleoside kinase [Anaerolineaceae bacterium]
MYIAIEGVIGVGKTTLARLLQPHYKAELLLEVFEENPFLSDFYNDRKRYAFQTQIFFLLSRYHQQRRATTAVQEHKCNLISDYTFDKDALFARVNLMGDELEMYNRVHQALAEKISSPDLMVYLKADTEVLMQRIASRDRSYERTMEREYICQLNQAYDSFFTSPPENARTLVIDTNDLNIISRLEDLISIDQRIKQALHLPPYQTELPLK